MRQVISLLFLIQITTVFGQNIPEMKPTIGYLVDKSPEGEQAFFRALESCPDLWDKVGNDMDTTRLTIEENEIFQFCLEENESYWDILGVGCSWYCGGGTDSLLASSELTPTKSFDYKAKNLHDLSYETAWAEGVSGFGIGEKVSYFLPVQSPRITEVIVVNGYVKSPKAWSENARVKKLKMSIDGVPMAILLLQDSRYEQTFSFQPIGHPEKESWKKFPESHRWTITFEIMEVYPGTKYEDTVLTEIYFNGIDVH